MPELKFGHSFEKKRFASKLNIVLKLLFGSFPFFVIRFFGHFDKKQKNQLSFSGKMLIFLQKINK